MRIAVIGAGCGGLVTLYTLQKRLKDRNDVEIVCYDGNSQLGGEWVYHPTDEGEPNKELFCLHGSMYDNLQSNNSKAIMQIHPDFPWPDDAPSFPRRKDALKYFEAFADKFQLAKYVRYNNLVTLIEKKDQTSGFLVSSQTIGSSDTVKEPFDYVIMCVGNHRIPRIPEDPSFKAFKGTVLHYHDLREPSRFGDKRILIVGSSFGALDLAITFGKRAISTIVSWNQSKPFWMTQKAEEFLIFKPKIKRVEGSEIFFSDGTCAEVDVVIFATGFKQYHPLSADLQLNFDESPIFYPLYKNTVHPSAAGLFFVGKAHVYAIHFCRISAEFACAIIQRRLQLPEPDEMSSAIQQFAAHWTAEFAKMTDLLKYYPLLHMQYELSCEMAQTVGIEPMPQYFVQCYYSLFKIMGDDLFDYQKYQLIDNLLLADHLNGIKTCFKAT